MKNEERRASMTWRTALGETRGGEPGGWFLSVSHGQGEGTLSRGQSRRHPWQPPASKARW